jgi:RNA polymerase sigma-70 factor (ECF subfamily)
MDRVFTTTHWSVVIGASRPESGRDDAALEKLCRGYWYPIYAFLRRIGWTAHDAEDLTQAFFERVLSKDYLRGVDRTKGKFRCFLLAMLRHFLANHRREARAQKRGGGLQFVCLDDESVDEIDLCSPSDEATPEQSFDRQWAVTLLEHVMASLAKEYAAAGKAALFDELKVFISLEKNADSYVNLALKLNTTEAALKMAVSRLRRRYGELLRAEIARTVSAPDEVEDELRALFAALG